MKSRILTKPPEHCDECEFYHALKHMSGQHSGLCLWRMVPVHFSWAVCEDRLTQPNDVLKNKLVIASQNFLTPPTRRKTHGDPRQDDLL